MDVKLVIFEDKEIRRHWDKRKEKWYFSVIDIVQALINQSSFQLARNYWKVLKNRLKKEGSEVVTNCNRLKLLAEDGKLRVWKKTKFRPKKADGLLKCSIRAGAKNR